MPALERSSGESRPSSASAFGPMIETIENADVTSTSAANSSSQQVMISGKPAQPDAGAGGGDDAGGMSGGCCQAPRDGATWALLGVPVAFVLLRRRRRN